MSRKNGYRINKIGKVIEERGSRIRRSIEQALFSDISSPELNSILKEINDNWSDVFRPALSALSCEAVGGQQEAADGAGLMFALASAGFGIHDDIIDRSERKHFRTTIFGRHGLENALLVGDLLIVKAWTAINEIILNVPLEKIKTIINEYGRLNVEICEAEFLENHCRKKLQTDLKKHENILWKAMAELEACTRIGAILGNGNNEEIQALAEFGRRLGFTYRLTDEIRDTLNIEGNLLHRIEHESVPLPILFASKYSEQEYQKVQSIIMKSSLTSEDIKGLLESCFESEAFEYVLDLAKTNKIKSLQILRILKPSKARDSLSFLARHSYANIAELIP